MALLNKAQRPMVKFDPSNKKHRKMFADAMKQRTLGTLPVQFYVDEEAHDLVYQIHKSIAQYVLEREFGAQKA